VSSPNRLGQLTCRQIYERKWKRSLKRSQSFHGTRRSHRSCVAPRFELRRPPAIAKFPAALRPGFEGKQPSAGGNMTTSLRQIHDLVWDGTAPTKSAVARLIREIEREVRPKGGGSSIRKMGAQSQAVVELTGTFSQ
jgi:hypothetical protein